MKNKYSEKITKRNIIICISFIFCIAYCSYYCNYIDYDKYIPGNKFTPNKTKITESDITDKYKGMTSEQKDRMQNLSKAFIMLGAQHKKIRKIKRGYFDKLINKEYGLVDLINVDNIMLKSTFAYVNDHSLLYSKKYKLNLLNAIKLTEQ